MSEPSREEALDMARTIGRTADLLEARRLAGEMIKHLDGKQNATAMLAIAMASAIMLRCGRRPSSLGPDPDREGCELDAEGEDVVADALPWLIRAWRDWIDMALEAAGASTSIN